VRHARRHGACVRSIVGTSNNARTTTRRRRQNRASRAREKERDDPRLAQLAIDLARLASRASVIHEPSCEWDLCRHLTRERASNRRKLEIFSHISSSRCFATWCVLHVRSIRNFVYDISLTVCRYANAHLLYGTVLFLPLSGGRREARGSRDSVSVLET